MRTATITEAKNGLSALIDHVRGGESVLILDRGVPVARLESAVGSDGGGRLARLERSGTVRPAREPMTDVLYRDPPQTRTGTDAVAALIADRRESR